MPKKTKLNLRMFAYGGCLAATLVAGTAPAALTYFVDPYEVFRTGELSKTRKEKAEKAHYPLWKFAHYDKTAELVVLGDSRARALRDKYWAEYGSVPAFNFAYGGGTIPEIYATFQSIKNDPKLKTLIVGIQLRSFDETHKDGLNRVPEAVETLLLPDVCFGCELPQKGRVFDAPHYSKGPNLGLGRGSRHIFSSSRSLQELPKKFERQVRKNAGSDWKGFRFSTRYLRMLKEISSWADARSDRQLIFVIPPTIVEMQGTIDAYGLSELNLSFRQKLARLAPVVDLDFPNRLTREIHNFSDAYHFNSKVARRIVGEIMTVAGATPEQEKRILKRRQTILCPSPELLAEYRTLDGFSQGQSCRVWERENDA